MRHRSLALAIVLAAAATGCDFHFDAQRIQIVATPDADRIDLLIEYDGLCFKGEKRSRDQVEALDRMLELQTVMIMDSWPLAVPLADASPGPELKQFLGHFALEPGPLFQNDLGQPATWQMVRITRVRELLAMINEAVRGEVKDQLERGKVFDIKVNERTRELLERALEERHSFIEKRGAALVFSMPCDEEVHSALRRKILGDLLRAGAEEAIDKAAKAGQALTADALLAQLPVRFLIENEWTMSRLGDRTLIVLGFPTSNRNLLVKPPQGEWNDGLKKALAAAGRGDLPQVTRAAIAERFAAFVRRERVGGPASRPEAGAASRPGR
jgi:hypothetical protein